MSAARRQLPTLLLHHAVASLSLPLLQTPEKKANDQRVRKRKADHFESGQSTSSPLTPSCYHMILFDFNRFE